MLETVMRAKGRRAARHALAHAFLTTLSVAGGTLLLTAPGLSDALRRLPGAPKSPRALSNTLTSLYRRGFITLTGTAGARRAQLTDAGKRLAYFESLSLPVVHKKTWDGMWYVVSFDIPVTHKRARDALRHALRRLGFREYQKSIYVYPHDAESEIDFVVSYFDVAPHVKRLYGADLTDEDRLRKLFKL